MLMHEKKVCSLYSRSTAIVTTTVHTHVNIPTGIEAKVQHDGNNTKFCREQNIKFPFISF